MNQYKFYFEPQDCNKIYFEELLLLLNRIHPKKETFTRIKKRNLLKIKCTSEFNSCEPDEFFFENKKQILLGRFFDTIGCFYGCKAHYFAMAMDVYSLFKNDVFIRYVIDKPELFINNSEKVELETIFPIRIILSKEFVTPTYADVHMTNIKEYTVDTLKKKLAISNDNLEIINKLPASSILKKLITEKFPINHIISRELCILYYMNLYFYKVENEDKTLKPFLLVSKYNLNEIKQLYKKSNKVLPKIKYFFKSRENKTKNQRKMNRKTKKIKHSIRR